MPAFGRDGGAWNESLLRIRDASAWTADGDQLFARLNGAWELIAPDPADSTLLAPTSLDAVEGDYDAICSWANPTQTAVPTEVQFRIPEITTVWTELDYPSTSIAVAYLDPETEYQFQVRYVIRVDGVITNTGPTATLFFTTTAAAGPGTPAADPGGSGPDSTTYWPPLAGGGAVGGALCWWGYVVEEFDVNSYTWSSSSVNGEVAGTGFDLDLDFIALGFSCGEVLRYKYREICNGVPQAWEYSQAFNVVCDYADPCGAVNQTVAFSSAPWNDADVVFAMPKICYENNRTNIEDFVQAGTIYGKLSGYHLPLYLNNAWEIRALNNISAYGEPVVAGHVPGLVPIGSAVPSLTSDFTLAGSFYLDEQPSAGSGAPVKLLDVGDTIKVYAYAQGAGWRITVSIPTMNGGTFDLASSTVLAVDTWHSFAVTIDQDGSKLLYINEALDVTDADTTRADFSDFTGNVAVHLNDQGRFRRIGGWGRVLTAGEIAQLTFDLLGLSPAIWLSAYEAGSIVTSGSNVTGWNDLSTNNRDTVVNGVDYPIVGTDLIEFTGTSELRYYNVSDLSAADIILGGGGTVLLAMMVRKDAALAGDGALISGPENGTDGFAGIYVTSSGAIKVTRGSATGSDVSWTSSATPLSDNDWHLVEIVRYATGLVNQVHVDGVVILEFTVESTGNGQNLVNLDIGHINGASRFVGDIAEIVSLASLPSLADGTALRAELAGPKAVTVTESGAAQTAGGLPTSLTGLSGLGAWIDANDSAKVVLYNGAFLVCVGDLRSATGATWTPGSAVAGPNGTQAFLRGSRVPNLPISPTLSDSVGFHIILAIKWDGTAGELFNAYNTGDTNDDAILNVDATGKLEMRTTTGGGGLKTEIDEAGTSMADLDWHCVEMILVPGTTSTELKVDGVSVGTDTYTAFGSAFTLNRFTFSRCSVSEIAILTQTGGAGATAATRVRNRTGL